ncbi:uromodulin-like 1 [Dendropsophus ebraccatus]|uniref:uromodulin-like 1 n=1 Tax=Dendropsophus ebraccatus TaxID=150705 RepID=UPI00383130EC
MSEMQQNASGAQTMCEPFAQLLVALMSVAYKVCGWWRGSGTQATTMLLYNCSSYWTMIEPRTFLFPSSCQLANPGPMISPWSYHICNYTATLNVSKVVAFQQPREEQTWCVSWIPWKLCTKTSYQTQYRTVYVPETSAVMRCCEGYELVGHYCALSLERSGAYASRPGICPNTTDKERGPKCTYDYDCPGLQKCCISSNGSFCASPAPPALDRNTIKYWYNGTIIIKMGYEELIKWDKGFVNHTRLLHSMVTGEFLALEVEVYHLSTHRVGTFSVVSSVLIGFEDSLPLMHIANMLNNIVVRIPEVISIEIQDLNECLYPDSCLLYQDCIKGEDGPMKPLGGVFGWALGTMSRSGDTHTPDTLAMGCVRVAQCVGAGHIPHPAPSDPPPVRTPITHGVTYETSTPPPCNCSMFHNHSITNVNSSGFHVHWNTDCPENYTYNVQVSSEGYHLSTNIRGTTMEIDGLQLGKIYTVQVTFRDCNELVQLWNGKVKTEAQFLNATLRITNWNLTESLQDPNSTEYADFLQKFIEEVKDSLSKKIPPERVVVQVESLSAGSIVVNFQIIVNDSEHYPVNLTVASFSPFSKEFQVDPGSIVVTDFNECLNPADNDCHTYADCKNLEGSYTCECRPSYMDRNPGRPGRNCEGGAPTSASPDSTGFEQVHSFSPFTKSTDPTTGSSVSPVDASPPTTAPHPGHLTDTKETQSGSQKLSSLVDPVPIAEVSLGPSPAQSVLTTPVSPGHAILGPVNTTTPDPVLTTSHQTTSSISSPGVKDTTEKVNKSGISTVLQVKEVAPTTSGKGIVTVIPVTARQTTSRAVSCSFPIMSVIVGTTSMPHLSPMSVRTTTQEPPALTLKEASTIMCVMGKIGIFIEKAYLNMMSIDANSLFLGSLNCSLNCSNETHIYIEAGWKDCNTYVDHNNTHIMVNSTLYVDLSSTFLNVTPKAISYIRCLFNNQFMLSSGYNPAGGPYTIIEKIEVMGSFETDFQLFIGDQPISPNITLSPTDEITVQIRIKTAESQYKVVIDECWATPTENARDPVTYPFIKSSCAMPNTFTTIHTNGISNNATFQTKIFSYVDKSVVYLHCQLHVCEEDPDKTCKPTCSGLRSANSGENVYTGSTRMGPLRKAPSNDKNPSSSNQLGPGYIALIVIGVLVLVAMVVSILICWHERRTGNYNFKIKTQDVGYRAFSN